MGGSEMQLIFSLNPVARSAKPDFLLNSGPGPCIHGRPESGDAWSTWWEALRWGAGKDPGVQNRSGTRDASLDQDSDAGTCTGPLRMKSCGFTLSRATALGIVRGILFSGTSL